MKKLLSSTAALIAALSLSGCAMMMAGGGYYGDHGDLVSSDGSVRYVGWCDVHRHNSHCLERQKGIALPPHPGAVALNSDGTPADLADIK